MNAMQVSFPDPDAEVRRVVKDAIVYGRLSPSSAPLEDRVLSYLREQGWDVTRRQS